MQRLACLDGLRGVLAVYVLLGHMVPFAAVPAWASNPLSHGGAAVDVFFILSGLVIVGSLETHGFAARPFLISRVARIFPVFLAMFALAIAVQPLPANLNTLPWVTRDGVARGIWSDGWPDDWAAAILTHLTMTHGLFPEGVLPGIWVAFLGSAWSLSTEWQFYLLALATGRSRIGPRRLAATFLLIAAAGFAWDAAAPEPWRFSRAFLPNKAHYFALGIASSDFVRRRSPSGFAVVLAATLVLCAGSGDPGKLLPPLVWTICLIAQSLPDKLRPIAGPLRWWPIQWLGSVSYPIYLANEPIQKLLGYLLGLWVSGDAALFTCLWLPGAVLIPIGAAAVLHRYVEQPGQRLGRLMNRRLTVHPTLGVTAGR